MNSLFAKSAALQEKYISYIIINFIIIIIARILHNYAFIFNYFNCL
jgi:hypothetical protein